VDGDECVPAGELTWSMSMDISGVSGVAGSAVLRVGEQYNVLVQVAQRGFGNPEFIPYTLKLTALPGGVFLPGSGGGGARGGAGVGGRGGVGAGVGMGGAGDPYYEIQLEPVPDRASGTSSRTVSYTASGNQPAISVTLSALSASAGDSSRGGGGGGGGGGGRGSAGSAGRSSGAHTHGADSSSSGVSSGADLAPAELVSVAEASAVHERQGPPLGTISFCRTRDLDRCLLDISDRGVVPLTPVTYLSIMKVCVYVCMFIPLCCMFYAVCSSPYAVCLCCMSIPSVYTTYKSTY
jgi:hypothetical protein